MRIFRCVCLLLAVFIAGITPIPTHLAQYHTYGFSVAAGATSYHVEARDVSTGQLLASETVTVSGSYHEHDLWNLKSQLPLSDPDVTLSATVAAGAPNCQCIGSQSTVDILD